MKEYGGTLRAVPTGPVSGLVGQVLLLTALAATVGLGPAGWSVGLASAVLVDAALAHGLIRGPTERLGPAGWVTLARATLALGVAALVADSFVRGVSVALLVGLAAVALALDYVDGEVARRTGTVSELGGRLDGEVDAFLILALSIYAAPIVGAWVLAIGAARYAFLAAGWLLPWMRAQLPRRDWRKTVAATQGIALAVAAADVLPLALAWIGLAAALALLAESFGRDVLWLWRHRPAAMTAAGAAAPAGSTPAPSAGPARRRRLRAGAGIALTVFAILLVWAALVAPDRPNHITFDAFARLPLEGLVVIGLALVLPRNARRVLAWTVGPLLGVLVVLKLLDVGFFTAFDRPFNPVEDWRYTSIGIETLRDSIGRTRADLVIVGVVLVVIAALALPTLAVLRVTRVVAGNRTLSVRAVTALGVAWALCWALGAQLAGAPIASTSAAELAVHEVHAVEAGLQDGAVRRRDQPRPLPQHAGEPAADRAARQGRAARLRRELRAGRRPGLVLLTRVDATLAEGRSSCGRRLLARSGWLTSPTFGGISWLAHSTLQSGLWVDSQRRYDQLMASHRFTLDQAFKRGRLAHGRRHPVERPPLEAGHVVLPLRQDLQPPNVGYHGPTYAYASMPDQYTYLALQRLELAKKHRKPVFAEIDTVSSHEPWTRIPPLISWKRSATARSSRRCRWTRPARAMPGAGTAGRYHLGQRTSCDEPRDRLVLEVRLRPDL